MTQLVRQNLKKHDRFFVDVVENEGTRCSRAGGQSLAASMHPIDFRKLTDLTAATGFTCFCHTASNSIAKVARSR